MLPNWISQNPIGVRGPIHWNGLVQENKMVENFTPFERNVSFTMNKNVFHTKRLYCTSLAALALLTNWFIMLTIVCHCVGHHDPYWDTGPSDHDGREWPSLMTIRPGTFGSIFALFSALLTPLLCLIFFINKWVNVQMRVLFNYSNLVINCISISKWTHSLCYGFLCNHCHFHVTPRWLGRRVSCPINQLGNDISLFPDFHKCSPSLVAMGDPLISITLAPYFKIPKGTLVGVSNFTQPVSQSTGYLWNLRPISIYSILY